MTDPATASTSNATPALVVSFVCKGMGGFVGIIALLIYLV
jgi:hypothetical protein